MTITAGIDIGTNSIKSVLFRIEEGAIEWLAKHTSRIRKRDPNQLAEEDYRWLLKKTDIDPEEVEYVATTGEGENVDFRTGHFYSMTTHARGASFLEPSARSLVDIGALHGRAISIDEHGKVLSYKMTSQCASGTGQFLENIARYLGVAQDEVGSLSLQADDPETVSSICAVLAETDVINMVSRGISSQNILKGIHLSMAGRLIKLLKAIKVRENTVLVTGGLAQDEGLCKALLEQASDQKLEVQIRSHIDSIYAGAVGAAIWGEFRHRKLKQAEASPLAA
ncbi:MAG TPA: benzoyl-CoA reductase subunit D [SAR324 cluster bacterium]|jgi:benzoyl-CoA reductase subunit D|nr:benzoyl-CoA reductase subunit D [SAR324 cluster bacterium]MEE1574569.1 benzoyl-CoA reductase subunit D [Deltaproteobacteria bacterium]MDP6246679.1 benzoyl-CoA reductase subunit D [SAR324 cluster bacterium]MDP6329885.1 benzoyl-CoA reductase subunit D [SAR324 cluster bacterium]MDP6462999.1 benzoyl-CoA reductase subunit D [SAR324 cluster bacterium]|tara:strand:+ start:5473 stop:6315 length:843 start_codon:yes stop_codon:yes gene_type:complete